MASEFQPEELTLQEKISLLQRPRASAPPPERALGVQHTNLSAADIADITPGRWLNDKVIDTVLRRLTLLRPGKFFAIDLISSSLMTEILDTLVDEGERDVHTRPVMANVAMLTGTKGTVLLPFNLENNHFLLVVIRLAERAIHIYDSMRVSDPNNVNSLLPGYERFLVEFVKKRVEWVLGFEPEEVSVIPPERYSVPCPQQGNSVDCGVAVCLTALHLISHPESPWTFSRPQFTIPGISGRYVSDTYWLAGRRIILELCKPCANLSKEGVKEALENTEVAIERSFASLVETYGRRGPEEQYYDAVDQVIAGADGAFVDPELLCSQQDVAPLAMQAKACRQRLTGPMLCVNSDLIDVLNHVRELGTAPTVDRDLATQRQAPDVVVSEEWAALRPEVARLAVSYAWHDVDEIRKARDDLARATGSLARAAVELYEGPGAAVPSLEALMEDAQRGHRGGSC